MKIVFLGLTITSSWGNGHATTYRGLVRELVKRGHDVVFLERDVPWYAANRDLPNPPYGRTKLYADLLDLQTRFTRDVQTADFVCVGSYVPEGGLVGEWALSTARCPVGFYDIDTPVTLAKLRRGDFEYLSPGLIPRYHLYLSFSGGPTLTELEANWGSPRARPLYCSVDPDLYFPADASNSPNAANYDLGYMGTWSADRQPPLDALLVEPARRAPNLRFVIAGPQYPDAIVWPANVARIEHIAPQDHRAFYHSQRFTLNITRVDMMRAGWSPSVRVFEALACGTPVISDDWPGLYDFFVPGEEILVSHSASETLALLRELPDEHRRAIGARGRQNVLALHTAAHRARELECCLFEL